MMMYFCQHTVRMQEVGFQTAGEDTWFIRHEHTWNLSQIPQNSATADIQRV